jgi:hypothetical protein
MIGNRCELTAPGDGDVDSRQGDGDGDGDVDSGQGDGDAGGDGDQPFDAAVDLDGGSDSSLSSCDPACSGDKPLCEPSFPVCVQCTAADTSECAKLSGKPHCLEGGDTCVACNDNDHCQDPGSSLCNPDHACVPCAGPTDCKHLTAAPVCDESAGRCVPCLPGAGNRARCAGKVCDMVSAAEPICADTETPNSADVCEPCVSDEQCKTGRACVPMRWDADGVGGKETLVGWFCQWKKNAGGETPSVCNSSSRPYFDEASVVSADKPENPVTICTLAAATCPAHKEYRSPCGRVGTGAKSYLVEDRTLAADGTPISPPLPADEIHPDDSVCGLGGRCATKNQADGAYLCSVPCNTSSSDCPKGIGISCQGDICSI